LKMFREVVPVNKRHWFRKECVSPVAQFIKSPFYKHPYFNPLL
jgi:hypothetical protein